MTPWLARHWVVGAGFMALGFLALAPVLATLLPLALFLIFLHTPGYMVHQAEEHWGDRFRRFANDRLFGGANVLTVGDVLVINLPIVWGMNLGALYAGLVWGAGYSLAAPYSMVVNAITHVAVSIRLRAYNPGMVTAILVFLPLSAATVWSVGATPGVWPGHHALGLGLAVALHLLIVANAMRRMAALR